MRISDWSSDVCSSDLIDRAEIVDDPGDAALTGLMVGHVPFIGGNAVFLAECARLFVIAALVGSNRSAGILQGQADGLADPACATGNNRDTSHLMLPSDCKSKRLK